MDSDSNRQHDDVSSASLTDETIATKRQKLSGTLTSSPSLPTLPFDLIPEILSRLPVKSLIQFQCVCKSWNSLISDPKFAEKHIRLSTTNLVHVLSYHCSLSRQYLLKSYPLDPVSFDVTTNHIPQLEFPYNHGVYFVGRCNGILCLLASDYSTGFVTFQLWNPSIRKFKEFPNLQKPEAYYRHTYGFGHDPITDNYKVVVVLNVPDLNGNFVESYEVKVHTLGTNSWKSIQKFPIGYAVGQVSGKFVCGTINWLVYKKHSNKIQCFIISLNLGNESYKEILLPDGYGVVDAYFYLHLGVWRDCLSMVFGHDVWVMKEHGNKDSWTKLFTISYMGWPYQSHGTINVIHIFEDGQVLLKSIVEGTWKLIFYNSRNGTFKCTQFKNIFEVYVESLISPCSLC